MEELTELLKQILELAKGIGDLAGAGVDALQEAAGGGEKRPEGKPEGGPEGGAPGGPEGGAPGGPEGEPPGGGRPEERPVR